MLDLKDVIAYLVNNYPIKSELSNARITKMIYLADWKSQLVNNSKISNINWYFDNYGPFVWDVCDEARCHPKLFKVDEGTNYRGQKKVMITSCNKDYIPNIPEKYQKVLDYVIETTTKLYWADFISLIYSTYPILVSERYSFLDLEKLAHEYTLSKINC